MATPLRVGALVASIGLRECCALRRWGQTQNIGASVLECPHKRMYILWHFLHIGGSSFGNSSPFRAVRCFCSHPAGGWPRGHGVGGRFGRPEEGCLGHQEAGERQVLQSQVCPDSLARVGVNSSRKKGAPHPHLAPYEIGNLLRWDVPICIKCTRVSFSLQQLLVRKRCSRQENLYGFGRNPTVFQRGRGDSYLLRHFFSARARTPPGPTVAVVAPWWHVLISPLFVPV